jgi:hypothetical protein
VPYASEAQREWAHTPEGRKALGDARVRELDEESDGLVLPERVAKPNRSSTQYRRDSRRAHGKPGRGRR